jgi:hypothetical protein
MTAPTEPAPPDATTAAARATEQPNRPIAQKLAQATPPPPSIGREVWRIAWRTAFFFLLLLAVLIMWRGSAVFLYEGF